MAGLHPLHDGVAPQRDAQLAAHARPPSVAADDEGGLDGRGGAAVEVAGGGRHAVGRLGERLDRGPVEDAQPGMAAAWWNSTGSMYIWLIRCGRLGRRPPRVGPVSGRVAVAAGGDGDPAQLIRRGTWCGRPRRWDDRPGRPAWRSAAATPSRRKISIERAEMWLHLTLGASAGWRSSATTTSTPREARSMARVSPTGPPPTTSTSAVDVRPETTRRCSDTPRP